MKAHGLNAIYGVLDYLAYPLGMLLVAPVVIHHMGAARYGIWTLSTAAVTVGSVVGSGFGDAHIRHAARQLELGRMDALVDSVRAMTGIHLVLGTIAALVAWLAAPLIANNVGAHDPGLHRECLWSLRLACVVMWGRTMESVPSSTQRAFGCYGEAVWVSVLARLGSLFLAAFLALVTHLVSTLVAATAAVTALGAAIQYGRLFNTLSRKPLWPRFEPEAMRALFGFGMFSWFQAVAGVVFGQADRLLLGASVGAAAVGSYALCTQLAQPVYGIAAAGLHFVFPLLAGRSASRQATPLRPILLWAFAANALFVAVATSLLLLGGPSVLRAWAGGEIASEAASLLPVIAWATALLSMSVTATYALFALGRVRVVTLVNVAGGLFSLLWMLAVVQREGTHGVALAKLFYGAWTLCLYVPLAMQLMKVRSTERSPEASAPIAEEA